jgi:hypothetical protein
MKQRVSTNSTPFVDTFTSQKVIHPYPVLRDAGENYDPWQSHERNAASWWTRAPGRDLDHLSNRLEVVQREPAPVVSVAALFPVDADGALPGRGLKFGPGQVRALALLCAWPSSLKPSENMRILCESFSKPLFCCGMAPESTPSDGYQPEFLAEVGVMQRCRCALACPSRGRV